jgi:hypothetical protein
MKRGKTTICAAAALTAVFLAGCKGDKRQYTLDYQIKKMFGGGRTPEEMAADAFNTKDPDVRRLAIEELSHKRWALRDPYLKRFAQLTQPDREEDPSVRAVAVRTLGRAGNTKYHPEILTALTDSAPMVRCDAAVVMQAMPNEKAIPTLQKMAISDESIDCRANAAGALRHYRTDPVYRTLLRCLNDEDFTARSAAHESLVFQVGEDHGYMPENWAGDPGKLGQETLPEPKVRYRKRPWWDWMKVTKETDERHDPPVSPQSRDENKEEWKRPWWDWGGVTRPKEP